MTGCLAGITSDICNDSEKNQKSKRLLEPITIFWFSDSLKLKVVPNPLGTNAIQILVLSFRFISLIYEKRVFVPLLKSSIRLSSFWISLCASRIIAKSAIW